MPIFMHLAAKSTIVRQMSAGILAPSDCDGFRPDNDSNAMSRSAGANIFLEIFLL